ncbi:MAG TPA: hypothetical protein VFC44_04310 [Candidatus Saccharimonadales bacterium]|nr:hypothetical protein [Candidatus Saccharimonadales bacterium]
MNTISAVSSSVTSSVASAVSQQTIAALQVQLAHYTQTGSGQNSQTSADYKALQNAIQSGNVSDAQVALARLQHDSAPPRPTPATSTLASAVNSDGSSIAVPSSTEGSLDTTA